MSNKTVKHIRTEDGTLFKITHHSAANFNYIELHQYDGDKFNEIESWDLRSSMIGDTDVYQKDLDEKKEVGVKCAEDYIENLLMKDIEKEVNK